MIDQFTDNALGAVQRVEIQSDVKSLTAADLGDRRSCRPSWVAARRLWPRGELTAATDHHGRRIAIGHNEDPRHDPAGERLVEPFEAFYKQ